MLRKVVGGSVLGLSGDLNRLRYVWESKAKSTTTRALDSAHGNSRPGLITLQVITLISNRSKVFSFHSH